MGKFLVGLILGLIVIPVCVYMYFSSGSAPVATSSDPMPFEKMLAGMALHARMDKEMPKSVPIAADESAFVAGAQIYKDQCAVCHGLPDQPKSAVSQGMFPKPPELFHGTGVTDDEPWETYWKVENGIRMTGMPGFKGQLAEKEIWQVTMLVKNADKVTEPVKKELLAGNWTPMSMAMPDMESKPAKETKPTKESKPTKK